MDQLVVTFTMLDKLMWSDGKPLTADELKGHLEKLNELIQCHVVSEHRSDKQQRKNSQEFLHLFLYLILRFIWLASWQGLHSPGGLAVGMMPFTGGLVQNIRRWRFWGGVPPAHYRVSPTITG